MTCEKGQDSFDKTNYKESLSLGGFQGSMTAGIIKP